jgi:predicted enzyme related to lactoylglutathione lyase
VISAIGAVLLISDDAPALARFYREALELPMEEERHEGVPPHYACDIDGTHFAIHPSSDWPGRTEVESQSPVIVFHTDDVDLAWERLTAAGVEATPPFDHGFAVLTAFQDPDGNNVQVLSLA